MVKSVVNVNDIISNSVIDGVIDHAVGQLVRVKHTNKSRLLAPLLRLRN